MSLQEIVNVQISRETAAVSQEGFGTAMILATHKNFPERLRYYPNASAMKADHFLVTDPAYLAVNAYFAQSPQPVKVAVGRRAVDTVTLAVTGVSLTTYAITINGNVYSFTSSSTTVADIVAGLLTAVNVDANVTATSSTAHVILTANVPGVDYTLSFTTYLAADSTKKETGRFAISSLGSATADVGDDLDAINLEQPDWYGLVITDRDAATVKATAAWTQGQSKIFGTASDDPNIVTTSESDIGWFMQNLKYTRTFVMYHPSAGPNTSASQSYFPEAALFGVILPMNPGSYTAKFKTLTGIPTTTLSDTAQTDATGKSVNVYVSVGGVSITLEGTVASGEYIDVIIGVDWLQARMTERIFGRLVNLPKIPFTDPGIAVIEAEIKAQLKDAVSAGLLAATPAPTVTVPLAKDISSIDKAARTLNGITFLGYLAGAIHSTTIQGVVTL